MASRVISTADKISPVSVSTFTPFHVLVHRDANTVKRKIAWKPSKTARKAFERERRMTHGKA